MIFVTVGTTEFDELIIAMDKFKEQKHFKDVIVAQIGMGDYIPENIAYSRWITDFEKLIEASRIVISHAGASTILECLRLKKKLIIVENKNVRRQADKLLRKLSNKKYLIWCKNMNELPNFIKTIDEFPFKEYHPPKCLIGIKILEFLGEDK